MSESRSGCYRFFAYKAWLICLHQESAQLCNVVYIYGRDESTGDVSGIYFFEDQESLKSFRETELAKTIPTAYEATEIRREVYEVLYPLYPDRGPVKN